MKKMLFVMLLVVSTGLWATSIKDIQYTTDASGDSPLAGQVVTISAEVTGEPGAFGGSTFFLQDSMKAWSGIYVYYSGMPDTPLVAEGDWITITGEVAEYYDKTQLKNITSLTIDSTGVFKIKPLVITTGELADSTSNAEAYEGVLVTVKDVEITNPVDSNGEWTINDGSGDVRVDDKADYYFWPDEYDSCLSVTGVMDYAYSNFKIYPRLAFDIIEGKKTGEDKIYTRIQRMQQVRYSDLVKTPTENDASDSYMSQEDTTILLKGLVTVPTELAYAGDGVKTILSDVHGGPWSAILSYAETGVYPVLYEGDLIEFSGYVGEYTTGASSMTEFWLQGDVTVLDYGQTLPTPPVVTTGDLRWPTTAEQWGNVFVEIKDAIVTELDIPYYVMGIDDGSGQVLVVADSDSLDGYVAPPLMTPIESITGWVYHHYGSYADSTTYGICPNYVNDIVLGDGPAMILDAARLPSGTVKSTETVEVSATIITMRNVTDASVFYRVNGGTYTSLAMTEGLDNSWSASIPAQADGSLVDYYYSVTDDSTDISLYPSDITKENISYLVLDSAPTIANIQYTPWDNGISPLVGASVEISGTVVTASDPWVDRNTKHELSYIGIASEAGLWNGIYVAGAPAVLLGFSEGTQVTVWGTVTEEYEDDYWKWSDNTIIDLDSIKTTGTGSAIEATAVTTGELAANPEAYEGVLVTVTSPTVISVNSYDMTINDGSGDFLLDDDGVVDSTTFDISYQDYGLIGGIDTLRADDVMTSVTGIVIYSYGSFKIEVRKVSDFGGYVGVENAMETVPSTFALHQNYPNPFNPTTSVSFDLPEQSDVKVVIYNITGQMVKTLTQKNFQAGHHILMWNGRNEMNESVGSGVYLYRIQAGEFRSVKKMTFIK